MITPQEKARNVYGEAVEKLVWDSRVVSDGCGVIVGQQDNDERRLSVPRMNRAMSTQMAGHGKEISHKSSLLLALVGGSMTGSR
jgi:hypothetical protein